MICKPCKSGARERFIYGNAGTANFMHADCKGGTWCDCQHDTTQSALNQKLVKNASRKEG